MRRTLPISGPVEKEPPLANRVVPAPLHWVVMRQNTFEQELQFESQERQDKASRLVEAVKTRLKEVNELIARGKGTWPQKDYVRDDTWAGWQAECHCLRMVLQRAGFDA